jgi:hypothetical protein
MGAERMAGGEGWGIEITLGPTPHADALHHALRAHVSGGRPAGDRGNAAAVEPVEEGGAGGLGRIAAAPAVAREAPGGLDAGAERMMRPLEPA